MKYTVYLPVYKVLRILKRWHPVDLLSLKQLTIKTLFSISITTTGRGQTLHLMNIKNVRISDFSISCIKTNKQKITKRVLKPKIVKCVKSSDPALDVCAYVKSYMLETSKFRNENPDLFFILGN